MSTATVYAKAAANIISQNPDSSFPINGWNVELSYAKSTGRTANAVYSFDVPADLYGKQVISGYLNFIKSSSTSVFGSTIAKLNSPDKFNVNTATWNNIVDAEPLNYQGSLGDRNQSQTSRAEIMARLLNGAYLFATSDYDRSLSTTITGKPSISITYNDVTVPQITQKDLIGYRNPLKAFEIQFSLTEDIIGPINITGAKIRWKEKDATHYSEADIPPDPYVSDSFYRITGIRHDNKQTIPPGTLPTGKLLDYQLQVQVNGEWWSQNTAWNTLSTIDSISTAIPKEPVNAIINVEVENTFRWQHVIATGSDPTGFDLQYSIDNYTWQQLGTERDTAETYCVVAANILPAGKFQWRIRTYNNDGITGEWSEPVALVGYGAPPTPIISEITNSARPTIRWQSATQIAYELIVQQDGRELVHARETAGADKAYTVSDFLQDGTYAVLVRIKNSGLYWSQWASADFTIRTDKPAPPIITGQPIENGVAVSAAEGPDVLYLLRDGIPIAKLYGGQAVDYGAAGLHKYVVRRVNAAGAFADSAPLALETKIEQALIAPADNPANFIGPLLQTQSNQYSSTASIVVELNHYAGRKYPVAVTDGTVDEEFSPVFAALTPDQWQALRNFMEDAAPVLYRNSAGDCAFCVISSLNPTKNWNGFTAWEMTMPRIDYVERIDYEEGI